MKKTILSCGLLAIAITGSAHAEDMPAVKRPADSPLQRLLLAHETAQFGRANKDALALIVAARLLNSIPQKDVTRMAEGQSDQPSESGASVKSLSEEAIQLSNKDPLIVALAADLASSKAKGHVNGIAASKGAVSPGKPDVYKGQKFEAGKYAEASVEALNSGEIRLSVYDEAGNLICRDPNPSTTSYCGWWPKATQAFTLKLENQGEVKVPYRVSTN